MSVCGPCNTRMYSPSPTVQASTVPLYQMGWLGDFIDQPWTAATPTEDTTTYIPKGASPTQFDEWAVLNIPGVDYTGKANADMTNIAYTQPGSGLSIPATSISNLFSSIFGPSRGPINTLAPGPAPRVSSVPFNTSGISSWIQQNFGLLAIGAVGVAVLTSSGSRRRR